MTIMTTSVFSRRALRGLDGWRWLAIGWMVLIGLMLLVALLPSTAWANDLPGRVGRIADTDGAVWMRDGDDREWMTAQRNRPLTERDRLATDDGARAELHVGSSTLRVGPGSEIEMVELNDDRVGIAVLRGSVALRVRSDRIAEETVLITDDGQFRPLRAGHYLVERARDSSFGEAWNGEMRFESRDSALIVAAGRRAEFWQERDGRTHYTWTEPQRDAFAGWALARDRDEQRYAANSSRHVPPEMTGAWELERYGRWDRHPEYGSLWYPSNVGADWSPYRHGQWAWVAPWGWTWVDDAPWGFAPFHYGRWVNWGGRWGWAPGRYDARPVYAPALVAWLGGGGGSHVSVGISIGGPTVGWVPLAPYEIYRPYYTHSPRYWQRVNPGHRYDDRRPVRTGPIMYTNQGVPGGVTVVPSNVLRERQSVARATLQPQAVDVRALRQIEAPPAAPRVVSEPGGARPHGLPAGLGRSLPAAVERGAPGRPVIAPVAPHADAMRPPVVRDLREQARDDARQERLERRDGRIDDRRDDARDGMRERAQPLRVERGPDRIAPPAMREQRDDDDVRERERGNAMPPGRVMRESPPTMGLPSGRVAPVVPVAPAAQVAPVAPVTRPEVPTARPTVPVAPPTVQIAPPPTVRAMPEVRDLRREPPPAPAVREIERPRGGGGRAERDDDARGGGPRDASRDRQSNR